MKIERGTTHTVDWLRVLAHCERQGPDDIVLLGIVRRFAELPKKVRRNVISAMDSEMQALSLHRGKPYVMPQKAYLYAVEHGTLIRPEGKRQTKAWKKVRTRAFENVGATLSAKQIRGQ